jgi:DNA repair exonuclease SbcCD nuclease subunit
MRFLHTSDLQIGKTFGFVDDETLAILRAERLEVIRRIGEIAVSKQASAVLVAGDIYDNVYPGLEMLLRPIERMRQFTGVEWHLIPGNHDPHIANSPWERLLRTPLPPNIVIHTTFEPRPIGDGSVWVLPGILNHRHMSSDPTAAFDTAVTPAGALRIGLAHGSIRSFGSTESSTNNVLAIDRAATAKLDYLALGDWHGMTRIDDRTWYSGTPEPDRFEVFSGHVLLVDVSPNTTPIVTPIESGRFFWHMETATVNSASDVVALESHIRGLNSDLSRVLVDLRVSGTLDMAAREQFEQMITTGLGSALRALRLDVSELYLKPTTEELEAIDHIGFVRVAADQLAALAGDVANPEREIAAEALQRLYVLHIRHMAAIQ